MQKTKQREPNLSRWHSNCEVWSDEKNILETGKGWRTVQGRDGQIQSAKVNVASKDRKPQVLRRVVQDLIPLEVSEWTLNWKHAIELWYIEQRTFGI